MAGYKFNAWLDMVMFSILGLIFLLTGVRMICKTKGHFSHFYTEYKCYLWFATIFLSIPLFFRPILLLA